MQKLSREEIEDAVDYAFNKNHPKRKKERQLKFKSDKEWEKRMNEEMKNQLKDSS